MATLFDYLQRTQRLIHDTRQQLVDPQDLISDINDARREVAMRSQCVRVLTPISGSISAANITNGGTGYTAPTVTISPPDMPSGAGAFPNGDQAIGSATQTAGVIDSVFIDYGGHGYFQPQITIHDPTGTGAAADPIVPGLNVLHRGKEVYDFADLDLSPFPGVGSVYTVRSVSVLFSNYRFSIAVYSFSQYQALIRNYAGGSYQYVPVFGAQFGRGTGGSFYFFPPPSQDYLMEWDCSCLPQDLLTNNSVEAIPEPWTDAIPYWAARNAFLEIQSFNNARLMEQLFDQRMTRFGAYAQPGRVVTFYGRP
jgi:hypothetical protein